MHTRWRPQRSAQKIREDILEVEVKLRALKDELLEVEVEENKVGQESWRWPLGPNEYERYGRQLILPNVGIQGQRRLKASRVLIVGAGGLGCPAAAYLAGAGVGEIGIVDGDTVEASNLHRQIAHSTSRVGMLKVDSVITYLKELNPLPTYTAHRTHLTPANAESTVSQYDLVLDCTDHPTSRYLISDICVLLSKPLVSASALRIDGQLIVLNCPPKPPGPAEGSPCYRCVFPKPPPPDSVVSCGEGGILGPVVGVMGVLQALEAVKIIAAGLSFPGSNIEPQSANAMAPPTMLLFSGGTSEAPSFRNVRMRGRRKECFTCSAMSTLTLDTLRSGSLDYVAFCGGASMPIRLLKPEERVSAADYEKLVSGGQGKGNSESGRKHLLLDVREKELFDICSIDGAVNVPYSKIQCNGRGGDQVDGATETQPDWIPQDLSKDAPIYVVCRVGNDSQLVAKQLKDLGLDRGGQRFIGDIKGGMRAWKQEVDGTLPFL